MHLINSDRKPPTCRLPAEGRATPPHTGCDVTEMHGTASQSAFTERLLRAGRWASRCLKRRPWLEGAQRRKEDRQLGFVFNCTRNDVDAGS